MTLFLAVLILPFTPAAAKKPKLGVPAPPFEVTMIDGTKVTAAELRGQVVVLNFWATWCVPCKRELPILDAYYQLQKKHGMRVFAITTRDSVSLKKLMPVAAILKLDMVRKIKGNYADLGGVPTNYVIDRAGILRYAAAGAFDLDDLNRVVLPLLRAPPPPPAVGN